MKRITYSRGRCPPSRPSRTVQLFCSCPILAAIYRSAVLRFLHSDIIASVRPSLQPRSRLSARIALQTSVPARPFIRSLLHNSGAALLPSCPFAYPLYLYLQPWDLIHILYTRALDHDPRKDGSLILATRRIRPSVRCAGEQTARCCLGSPYISSLSSFLSSPDLGPTVPILRIRPEPTSTSGGTSSVVFGIPKPL
jgi:hypothetical protein